MRAASKVEFIEHGGTLVGVILHADFCAEHEWGITGIQRHFGLPYSGPDSTADGLVRRKITQSTLKLRWGAMQEGSKKTPAKRFEGFEFAPYRCDDRMFTHELRTYQDGLIGAWSEGDFAVLSNKPEEIAKLKEIFDRFADLDIAIWMGGNGNPFGGGGLCIGIASRLPEEWTTAWARADRDRREIEAEVVSSGIRELLKEKGCEYFALSPRRVSDGQIQFWLNPMKQDRNNFGWFSLEDLKLWADGRGPIPMKGKNP